MTQAEATTLVGTLSTAYAVDLEETRLAVYVNALRDLPAADGAAAVHRLLKTSHWFPSVAEIRETVLDLRLPLPTAAEAWELVEETGRRALARPYNGRDSMQTGLPGIVARALKLSGGEYGYRYSENINALRAQFLRLYADLRDSAAAGGAEARQRALKRPEPIRALPAGVKLPELRTMPNE